MPSSFLTITHSRKRPSDEVSISDLKNLIPASAPQGLGTASKKQLLADDFHRRYQAALTSSEGTISGAHLNHALSQIRRQGPHQRDLTLDRPLKPTNLHELAARHRGDQNPRTHWAFETAPGDVHAPSDLLSLKQLKDYKPPPPPLLEHEPSSLKVADYHQRVRKSVMATKGVSIRRDTYEQALRSIWNRSQENSQLPRTWSLLDDAARHRRRASTKRRWASSLRSATSGASSQDP